MKQLFALILFCHCAGTSFLAQTTSGDNSPAIIAKNFSAVYGVRADAVEAILKIYEKDGLDPAQRKSSTESLLKKYQQAPEKKSRAPLLSDASKKDLGLSTALANVLDWDLYAGSKYLTTTGINSPAVVAEGDVNIWYGIPPKALRALTAKLEEDKITFEDFQKKLDRQVERFKELEKELASRADYDAVAKQAQQLLNEGKIGEAEKLLEEDFEASEKRLAYKAYELGGVKELALKYAEAAKYLQKAVALNPNNSTYLLVLGNIVSTNADYDSAIEYFQKALAIDTMTFKDKPEKVTVLYNSFGVAYGEKGEHDRAIAFYEKALAIDSIAFGNKHPNVAALYNNLGGAWKAKGEYDRALAFYEKAFAIDSSAFGNKHPNAGNRYNNLGSAWQAKGEYDRAIVYYEKALAIDSIAFGNKHPAVAIKYNNLGSAWRAKGEYVRAFTFFEKALAIDSIAFGNNHPAVARGYNNLGGVWQAKGEYDRAIALFEKALTIDSIAFGSKHPAVALKYNNLGSAWQDKGEYDRAIALHEKALAINSIAFGSKHPAVARGYNNLGEAYREKGEYNRAIGFFEKALAIFIQVLGKKHPNTQTVAQNLSNAANSRGMEFFREKKYPEALQYFQKALNNAEAADDWAFSLTCLNNIGSMHKRLGRYAEGLAALEKGTTRAQELEQKSGKPEYTSLIRRMQYHAAGCLAGLGRKEEANKFYQQLLKQARETNDTRLLEDLKIDGVKD